RLNVRAATLLRGHVGDGVVHRAAEQAQSESPSSRRSWTAEVTGKPLTPSWLGQAVRSAMSLGKNGEYSTHQLGLSGVPWFTSFWVTHFFWTISRRVTKVTGMSVPSLSQTNRGKYRENHLMLWQVKPAMERADEWSRLTGKQGERIVVEMEVQQIEIDPELQ